MSYSFFIENKIIIISKKVLILFVYLCCKILIVYYKNCLKIKGGAQ